MGLPPLFGGLHATVVASLCQLAITVARRTRWRAAEPSALRCTRLIGSPINFIDCLIDSPISSQSTGGTPDGPVPGAAAGRLGWLAKGTIYGILGALCIHSGISGQLTDTSPQVRCRHRLLLPVWWHAGSWLSCCRGPAQELRSSDVLIYELKY